MIQASVTTSWTSPETFTQFGQSSLSFLTIHSLPYHTATLTWIIFTCLPYNTTHLLLLTWPHSFLKVTITIPLLYILPYTYTLTRQHTGTYLLAWLTVCLLCTTNILQGYLACLPFCLPSSIPNWLALPACPSSLMPCLYGCQSACQCFSRSHPLSPTVRCGVTCSG